MSTANHYEVLGIKRDATADQIRHAFRKQASLSHPDRESGSETLMQEVNKAYEVLGDPSRREQYDRTGIDGIPQSAEDQAKVMLMQMFSAAMNDPYSGNWLKTVQTMLDQQASQLAQHKRDHEGKKKRLTEKRANYVSSGEQNLVHMLIDQQLTAQDHALSQLESAALVLGQARAIIKDYKCLEPEIIKQSGVVVWRTVQLGTTA